MEEWALSRRSAGEMQETTWSEVEVGHIVRDQRDRLHTVIHLDYDWVWLESAKTGETATIGRPSGDRSVSVYVPSEEEALVLLGDGLGATVLREIEEREHTIARRLNWQMEPVAANAKTMRDHLDMVHGIRVDDVLRKHTGTKVNPAPKGQKAAAMAELRELHDEAHADPDMWPMPFPHSHTLTKEK